MTAPAAAIALPVPRQWAPPTLTEHSDLVMMARALAEPIAARPSMMIAVVVLRIFDTTSSFLLRCQFLVNG